MRLTITFQSGSLAGKSWDFSEGFLVFGRGNGCNVVFDPVAENMVSTKHAYFEVKPDGFYLVDSKSTNGTFVNGQRVQVTKMNSGDLIQFGKNGPLGRVALETVRPIQSPEAVTEFIPVNQHPSFGQQQQKEALPESQPLPPQSFQNQPPLLPIQPPPPADFQNSMSSIGLSNPVVKTEPKKSRTGAIIGAIAALAIYGLLALLTIFIIASEVGVVVGVIATIIAFIPPIIYILPLIFLDRYDPEPPWLIASAFAWGGLVATFFSIIVNSLLGAVAGSVAGSAGVGQLFGAVISAPIFEEFSKGLGVVLIMIFFRKEFDDILDGIVYGGVIGLGFATVENILYYGRELPKGTAALAALFVMRGVLSPFIHSTFTAMTGIGCGIARESHKTLVRIIMPILGYIVAVILHMIWNGVIAFLIPIIYVQTSNGRPENATTGFLIGYVVLAVPFFLIFIGFCLYTMRRQNRILREMLAMDAARGLISQEQMKTATSAFKGIFWLIGGIFSGKFFKRWRFLRAVGKLGLSYWHIQRANAAQGQTGSFQTNPVFRAQVEELRDNV